VQAVVTAWEALSDGGRVEIEKYYPRQLSSAIKTLRSARPPTKLQELKKKAAAAVAAWEQLWDDHREGIAADYFELAAALIRLQQLLHPGAHRALCRRLELDAGWK
jgi:hypothetical protein